MCKERNDPQLRGWCLFFHLKIFNLKKTKQKKTDNYVSLFLPSYNYLHVKPSKMHLNLWLVMIVIIYFMVLIFYTYSITFNGLKPLLWTEIKWIFFFSPNAIFRRHDNVQKVEENLNEVLRLEDSETVAASEGYNKHIEALEDIISWIWIPLLVISHVMGWNVFAAMEGLSCWLTITLTMLILSWSFFHVTLSFFFLFMPQDLYGDAEGRKSPRSSLEFLLTTFVAQRARTKKEKKKKRYFLARKKKKTAEIRQKLEARAHLHFKWVSSILLKLVYRARKYGR